MNIRAVIPTIVDMHEVEDRNVLAEIATVMMVIINVSF